MSITFIRLNAMYSFGYLNLSAIYLHINLYEYICVHNDATCQRKCWLPFLQIMKIALIFIDQQRIVSLLRFYTRAIFLPYLQIRLFRVQSRLTTTELLFLSSIFSIKGFDSAKPLSHAQYVCTYVYVYVDIHVITFRELSLFVWVFDFCFKQQIVINVWISSILIPLLLVLVKFYFCSKIFAAFRNR